MRVKLMTFRYSASLGGFDETPLKEFIRDKEVLAFREHFFTVNDTPHLACVLTYQEPPVSLAALAAARELRAETSLNRPSAPGEAEVARPAPISGAGAPGAPVGGRFARADRPDPTAGLDERDRALFQTLRSWRAETARREGVPPYVVLTNRQLVEVVVRKPESRTAMASLDGIGAPKVERYAGAVLALLHGSAAGVPRNAQPVAGAGAGHPGAGGATCAAPVAAAESPPLAVAPPVPAAEGVA